MEQSERERDVASNVAGGTLKTDERENNPCKDKQRQRQRERDREAEREGEWKRESWRATAGEFAAKQLQGELRSIACLLQADQHQLSRFRVPTSPCPHPLCNAVDSGTDVRFLMYYFGNELAVFNLMNRDGNNNNNNGRRNLMQRQKMDSYGNSHALYAYQSVCVCVLCVCLCPCFVKQTVGRCAIEGCAPRGDLPKLHTSNSCSLPSFHHPPSFTTH